MDTIPAPAIVATAYAVAAACILAAAMAAAYAARILRKWTQSDQ